MREMATAGSCKSQRMAVVGIKGIRVSLVILFIDKRLVNRSRVLRHPANAHLAIGRSAHTQASLGTGPAPSEQLRIVTSIS